MNRTPNSKDIRINRYRVGRDKPFLCSYIEPLMLAMRTLTPRAFEVYIYLLGNKNGYVLNYSPQHISEVTGMCLETARKAFKELEETEYLIPTAGRKSFYDFYGTPKNAPITENNKKCA